MVAPLDIMIDQITDPSDCGVEQETPKLRPETKNPDVTLVEVYEDARGWIHD